MWNYAELSQAAKQCGGPEKLVNVILDSGINKGRFQGIAIGAGLVVLSVTVVKVWEYFKRNKDNKEKIDLAKRQLIDGINSYDAQHPERIERIKRMNSDDIEWYCDDCGSRLNNQFGFTTATEKWTCANCGCINDVSGNNILF